MSFKTLDLIKTHQAKWIDLRFTDTQGKENHMTIPAHRVDEDFFDEGIMFDGSSISGWKGINESDMIMMPDDNSAVLDPFAEDVSIILYCDILEPATNQAYSRDPRSLAKRAEAYLKSTSIADTAFFGPEPEFFIFDEARWQNSIQTSSYFVDLKQAPWNSNSNFEDGNLGHRLKAKGGYAPVPPLDKDAEIRASMCNAMEQMGLEIEIQHHEVAPGQNEIGVLFNTLTKKADEVQILKYCVHNSADLHGKTATFMPKPLVGDNGSGMHVHQSLMKDGVNLFAGENYGGLSEMALFYIGGIIKHAKALNAFANSSTNSYKRLVPGFEAPVMLAYSAKNRSASIRIPFVTSPKAKRIEARFPDPSANPYLCFAALLMAGLDGIQNRIHPGDPMDKNLYDLPPEEAKEVPQVANNLEEALINLDTDRNFLLKGGVFTDDIIDAFIELKRKEIAKINQSVHPLEFELYYSV